HFQVAVCRLLRGDYAGGWPEFAWRTRIARPGNYSSHPFGIPQWSGQSVAGRLMLMHGEQGLGDTIQFARFAQHLAEEGAEVDLFCHPPLVSMMSRVPGIRTACDYVPPRLPHAFHAAIGDAAARYLPTAC